MIIGIVGVAPLIPSAIDLEIDIINPNAWYKLNETSGTTVTDSINSETGTKTNTIVQEPLILYGTGDTGSLQMTTGNSFTVPNSITDGWNANSENLETIFMSFWFRVDSLASTIRLVDHTDNTKFNVDVTTDGRVGITWANSGAPTISQSPVGSVVAGQNAFISFWVSYNDDGGAASTATFRGNVNGHDLISSIGGGFSGSAWWPNLNLSGYTFNTEDGAIDELIIKYGNVASGGGISLANGVAWGHALYAAGPPVVATTPTFNPDDHVNMLSFTEANKRTQMGTTNANSGGWTYAIPRNGKVYFELEILSAAASDGTPQFGIRRLDDPSKTTSGLGKVTSAGLGYHYYRYAGGNIRDENTNIAAGVSLQPGNGTNVTWQMAIDWNAGDWWIGRENLWAGHNGVSGSGTMGNPSTEANGLGLLAPLGNSSVQWAASVIIYSAWGGNSMRLVTDLPSFQYTPPTGYSSWDDAI